MSNQRDRRDRAARSRDGRVNYEIMHCGFFGFPGRARDSDSIAQFRLDCPPVHRVQPPHHQHIGHVHAPPGLRRPGTLELVLICCFYPSSAACSCCWTLFGFGHGIIRRYDFLLKSSIGDLRRSVKHCKESHHWNQSWVHLHFI